MIRLYFKISENIECPILQNGFWVVYLAKFKFLAQFPVDPIPYPVVFCLILVLRSFVAFAYYMIDRFVSFTT